MAVKGQAVCHDATESDLDWMSEEDDFINLDFSTSGENQVASGVEDSCLILDVGSDIDFDSLLAVVIPH